MPVRRLRTIAAALLLAAGALFPIGAGAEPVGAERAEICGTGRALSLASIDWPPYSGAGLRDQGAVVAVARAAFAAVGCRLEVRFYPWNRAVMMARDGMADGYLPEYADAETARNFLLSEPMGHSPLVFAERVAAPVDWSGLDDLAGRRIGVVDGYGNTAEIDRRIADGRLHADKAVNDAANLRKLAAGRTDLAVIDLAVMRALLRSPDPAPDLEALADRLRPNPRILEMKSLHIAFGPGERGRALARLFAEGMARINGPGLLTVALGG